MTILLAALAIAAQPPAPLPDPNCPVLFSRALALARASETICVRLDRADKGEYAVQRTATDRRGVTSTSSTTTRACPAARAHLARLEELTLPTPDVPGLGREMETVTMDGVSYRLRILALYDGAAGDLSLSSNVGTPLARWIDATLQTLSACWRDRPGS